MRRRPNFSFYPLHSHGHRANSIQDSGVLAYWTSRWMGYAALLAGFAIAALILC